MCKQNGQVAFVCDRFKRKNSVRSAHPTGNGSGQTRKPAAAADRTYRMMFEEAIVSLSLTVYLQIERTMVCVGRAACRLVRQPSAESRSRCANSAIRRWRSPANVRCPASRAVWAADCAWRSPLAKHWQHSGNRRLPDT